MLTRNWQSCLLESQSEWSGVSLFKLCFGRNRERNGIWKEWETRRQSLKEVGYGALACSSEKWSGCDPAFNSTLWSITFSNCMKQWGFTSFTFSEVSLLSPHSFHPSFLFLIFSVLLSPSRCRLAACFLLQFICSAVFISVSIHQFRFLKEYKKQQPRADFCWSHWVSD